MKAARSWETEGEDARFVDLRALGEKPMSPRDVSPKSDSWLVGFGAWAANSYDLFPDEALHEARLSLLDTLGCIHAGWDSGQSRIVVKMTARETGEPQALGLAALKGLTAGQRALLFGTAAHSQDFDDYETAASTHPSAVLIAALLAASELTEPTYREFLEAYLTGYAMITRCGEVLGYSHYERGWHATATLGGLGAAAACGRLLRSNADALTSGVSIATSMAAGLKRQFGSQAKALHAGLAARGGLEAALLAASGLKGNPMILEGSGSFLDVYGGSASRTAFNAPWEFGAEAIRRNPVYRKPWPCCGYALRAIEAACELSGRIAEERFDIASGMIRSPKPYASVVAESDPRSPDAARFSLTYCVASALIDGEVTPQTFVVDALGRTEVRALMSRLKVDAYDPGSDVEDISPAHPDSISVVLGNGREVSTIVEHVRGGGARPMKEAEILRKFLDCGGLKETAECALGAPEGDTFSARHVMALSPD